jgi:hypothetical protein
LLHGRCESGLELGIDGKHRCDDKSRHQGGRECEKGFAVTGTAHSGSYLLFRPFDPFDPPVVGPKPLVRSN